MNKLTQIFSYIKSILRVIRQPEMPPDLIFFVTSHCNARCEYCHFIEQIKDPERKKRELTSEEIELIAKNYGKLSKLSLSGGEPFIRNDLARIIQAFIDHCETNIIDIPTNGFYTDSILKQTKAILENNPNIILEIQLSIDGPEDTHDRLRNIRGLYKKIIYTYEQLSVLQSQFTNLRIKMNLTYQQGNEDVVWDMARDFDAKYIFDRFQITFPHGYNILKEKINELNYKAFYKLSRQIQIYMKFRSKYDLHSLIFRAIKIIRDESLLRIIKKGDMGRLCGAGRRIAVIDDIGDVFPCEPLWTPVGNVRDNGYIISNILNSESMSKFRSKYLGAKKCHCTWGCVVLDNIIFNPSYYPVILFYMAYLFIFGGRGFRNCEK
ncbi:radical SAM protein [Candidatus Magnetominusculus xianensis]|uniref:Radical SAM protein n=1 Tax=Candidatus Magnetominusculus xianensis TaxID=1748249 RepID=A0ABR5SGL1_9BACT|nr:radical SAM protein [Candidatus Magnetominusculus xianensis]KWT90142.1 radical SAM protein [Candidatus Magnetominusculus xianensis]MBF0403636.1 radical SAM protein [Nitrospirota bacterium]